MRVCPLCFIEIDFLMAHQMCPRCDTHLVIFLAMMHDSSYWCAIGGEQYISQRFTTFRYSTEAKVIMEQVQQIMVDTDSGIISRRTPETFTALMFRTCGEQNYVPDLVVQCACFIIQIVLRHTYAKTRKPLRYYSISVCMYKFFFKLGLPHWLKQEILSVFKLLEEGQANINLCALKNAQVKGHTSVSLCNIYLKNQTLTLFRKKELALPRRMGAQQINNYSVRCKNNYMVHPDHDFTIGMLLTKFVY